MAGSALVLRSSGARLSAQPAKNEVRQGPLEGLPSPEAPAVAIFSPMQSFEHTPSDTRELR